MNWIKSKIHLDDAFYDGFDWMEVDCDNCELILTKGAGMYFFFCKHKNKSK